MFLSALLGRWGDRGREKINLEFFRFLVCVCSRVFLKMGPDEADGRLEAARKTLMGSLDSEGVADDDSDAPRSLASSVAVLTM